MRGRGAPRRRTSGAQGRRSARGRIAVLGVTSALRGHLRVARAARARARRGARARLRAEPARAEPQPRRDGAHRLHGAGDREPRRGARPARRRGGAAGGRATRSSSPRRRAAPTSRGLRPAAAPAPRRRVRAGARRRRRPGDAHGAGARARAVRALRPRRSSGSTRRACCSTTPRRRASPARTCSALGHRRIAFVAGTPTVRVTPELEHGLADGDGGRAGRRAARRGRRVQRGVRPQAHPRAAARRRGADGADRGQRPGRARRPAGRCASSRLRPGRDISLVCAENPPTLRVLDPPVAAISWDYRRVGRTLAELLLQRLAGGPAERVVVRATFVPGESCAPPSAARVA